jgi:hypothetical protein
MLDLDKIKEEAIYLIEANNACSATTIMPRRDKFGFSPKPQLPPQQKR